jgi:CheY-like chemotaxis protein
MSKSLGNFFTIRDILKSYDAEVVRFFILTAHYRSPIDFSDQNLEESRLGLTRFYEALAQLEKALAKADKGVPQGAVPESLEEPVARLTQLEERFRTAMDDDFNTALAIGHMFDAVRASNRILAEENNLQGRLQEILGQGRDDLLRLGEVLGLFVSEPSAWLARSAQEGLSEAGLSAEEIERLIVERREARANKDFSRRHDLENEINFYVLEFFMAKKIMIVDDSPSVLAILDDMLVALGYEVTTADNGQQGCELLENNRYDLIITDLTMPVMDGITFVQTAKQMPNCKFVPIVMLSSEEDEAKIAEAKQVGISTFLRKPVKEVQLKTILQVVLGS